MSRLLLAPLACLLLYVNPAHSADDDDDDPTYANKKVSEWVKILHDKSAPVKQRRAALIVMGIADPKHAGVVPALIAALRQDADEDVRRGAAQTLGQIKPPADKAVDSLGHAAKADPAAIVRAASATALGRMGPAARLAVPELLATLKDKEPGPRAAAAEAIGLVGADAEEAVPLLVDALADRDRNVRLHVVMTLGRFGPNAHRAAAGLGGLVLKDDVVDVRKKAAEALGQIGAPARVAAPALVEALQKDKDVDVRRWSAIALTRFGTAAKDSVPTLVTVLTAVLEKEPDRYVRGQVVHVLGKFGKEAVGALKKCVQSDVVVEVRLAAIDELGAIGPDARDDGVIRLLNEAARDNRATVREAAENALKKIQPKP